MPGNGHVPFGKRPSEKDPNHGHLVGGPLHPVGDGRFLYLATVIDLYSRRLAGWSIAEHMRTDLVADALRAAATTRGGDLHGAIFHSDNGAQYASKQFAELCDSLGVTRSRGKVGTSVDNAAAESFNASLKRETLQGAKRWPGAHAARLAVFRWVHLLRHPTAPLRPRPTQPHRLRTPIRYHSHSRITTGVHYSGTSPVARWAR
jgi:transposase InsO family protein